MYLHRARVTTVHPFPLDMLRYDSCFPNSSEDAVLIEKSIKTHPREAYTVTVARYGSRQRDHDFTPARWRSFGCAIESVS